MLVFPWLSLVISSPAAAWMPRTYLKFANGPWKRSPAKPVQDYQAMKQTITSDLVEAYSLCPRKAFLMMTGVANPGKHEYVRITDEQAAANRQTHRASLGQAEDFPPGGVADLSTGPNVIADAGAAAPAASAWTGCWSPASGTCSWCWASMPIITTCIVRTGRCSKARPAAVHIHPLKWPVCEFYAGTGSAA